MVKFYLNKNARGKNDTNDGKPKLNDEIEADKLILEWIGSEYKSRAREAILLK